MANECINLFVFSANDTSKLIDLFASNELNYKEYEFSRIDDHTYTTIVATDDEPATDFTLELSKQFPDVTITLWFIIKLLNRAGQIIIEKGKIDFEKEVDLKLTLADMKKPISLEVLNALVH